MTQSDLAGQLGVKNGTVSGYESEKSEGFPSVEVLIKLTEIFSVSLDDLVFRNIETEGMSSSKPVDEDKEAMAKRLNEMLEYRIRELERYIREKDQEGAKELGIN